MFFCCLRLSVKGTAFFVGLINCYVAVFSSSLPSPRLIDKSWLSSPGKGKLRHYPLPTDIDWSWADRSKLPKIQNVKTVPSGSFSNQGFKSVNIFVSDWASYPK